MCLILRPIRYVQCTNVHNFIDIHVVHCSMHRNKLDVHTNTIFEYIDKYIICILNGSPRQYSPSSIVVLRLNSTTDTRSIRLQAIDIIPAYHQPPGKALWSRRASSPPETPWRRARRRPRTGSRRSSAKEPRSAESVSAKMRLLRRRQVYD